jgi:hypothetical protein
LERKEKNQSTDYADYTDFKTKRLRELEAQSGNKFKEHSLSADYADFRRLLFKNKPNYITEKIGEMKFVRCTLKLGLNFLKSV